MKEAHQNSAKTLTYLNRRWFEYLRSSRAGNLADVVHVLLPLALAPAALLLHLLDVLLLQVQHAVGQLGVAGRVGRFDHAVDTLHTLGTEPILVLLLDDEEAAGILCFRTFKD